MEKVYWLVKSWYDDGMIGSTEWQEFCTAMLENLMEDTQNILKNI